MEKVCFCDSKRWRNWHDVGCGCKRVTQYQRCLGPESADESELETIHKWLSGNLKELSSLQRQSRLSFDKQAMMLTVKTRSQELITAARKTFVRCNFFPPTLQGLRKVSSSSQHFPLLVVITYLLGLPEKTNKLLMTLFRRSLKLQFPKKAKLCWTF